MQHLAHESAARHLVRRVPTVRPDATVADVVGLAGSLLSALVVRRFEGALRAHVTIACFLPAIVYLADAIGTQTEAIAVRGLMFARGHWRGLLWGELRTGLLLGVVLAAGLFPCAWATLGDLRIALAVAVTVVVAGTIATSVGLLLPLTLSRLHRDPAFGSGPVATIIQDILSLLVYFLIVTAVV